MPSRTKSGLFALAAAAVLATAVFAHAGSNAVGTDNYRVFKRGDIDAEVWATIPGERERTYRRVIEFIGDGAVDMPRIDFHVYPSVESKGLASGNTQLAHADHGRFAVHVVVDSWISGDDGTAEALLMARRHFGLPATNALEPGLAVYLSDNWRGSGYAYWASLLQGSGNLPPLRELLDNEVISRESYLVVQPAAASFVAFLLERFGHDVFVDNYAQWVAAPGEIASLEKGWHDYLQQLDVELPASGARHGSDRNGFQKGFCHAHMGYEIFDGYGSRKSDEALAGLAELGTNAVSITPFSYMRDPTVAVPLPFSNGAGSENDESVIHTAHTAQQLGMTTMLKPHIWLGQSWPGAIDMGSAAEWDLFFDYYYRWMRHYALLGEMYHLDILCVGVELCKATVGHEDQWTAMFDRLRGIFSGELTYAANWGEEFENVAFWQQLDYIGVNCYYPLSADTTASAEELRAGAAEIMTRIATVAGRFDKPVLLTEIGFTSTETPWLQPHEAAWREQAFPNHQALCYEAIFEALHGQSWCKGIYWWKWPSFLEYGGLDNAGFTPNGKPAQAVVREWYGKAW